MSDINDVLGFHFLRADRRLRFAPHTLVEVGQTLTYDGTPILCESGMHASEQVLQALEYAPQESGIVLCRVRLSGTIVWGEDKLTATARTVLGMVEADPLLHEFACWNAEAALYGQSFRGEIDPRSLRAIQVKRAWVRGEATDADLDAAWAAAWDAAWDAARAAAWAAARDAAWAAAWDAARDAAWAAARDAARDAAWAAAWDAARAAARAAAWAAANTKLEAMALAAMDLAPTTQDRGGAS